MEAIHHHITTKNTIGTVFKYIVTHHLPSFEVQEMIVFCMPVPVMETLQVHEIIDLMFKVHSSMNYIQYKVLYVDMYCATLIFFIFSLSVHSY